MKFIDQLEVRSAILSSITEGLLVCNKTGEIVFANEACFDIFGYSSNELLNQKIEMLIPKKVAQHHHAKRDSYFSAPSKRKMGEGRDLKAVNKNKQEFPVEVSLNYFKVKDQTFALALVTNISERKKIEHEIIALKESLEDQVLIRTKELEENKLMYEAVARNFPNGTINVFDNNFNYLFVEGRELYKRGVTSEDLIGQNYFKKLPAEVSKIIREKLSTLEAEKEISFEVKFDNQTYQLNALYIELKNVPQILIVEQNITNQKDAQSKIQEALEKQKDLSELKSRFVSMASHEFRTPLSTILSSANLAERYIDPHNIEKQKKHLSRIKSSVKNLTTILNDFLSLSKLEEGKVNINITEFNLNELIHEVTEELMENFKEGQKVSIKSSKEYFLKSDQNILKNILINLMSNASKYSEAQQEITIEVKSLNNKVSISIIDQGMGMSKDDQQHLFERFFRASNVSNIQGTGLGLHIVMRYIKMLDGDIAVKSELNNGSSFTIQIPNI